jgi:hypothetical protein
MSIQLVPILISSFALLVAIGSFLSSRQSVWSYRYFTRWSDLAKIVFDNPALWELWCSLEVYNRYYGDSLDVHRHPHPQELVFVEMYVDFMYEVQRRSPLSAFITGRYPGIVSLTNPRAIYIYDEFIRHFMPDKYCKVIDRAISRSH